MTRLRVENIQPDILRQCREQIGLDIEQAQRKVSIKTLDKIEEGEVKPTFNQLAKLANLYQVPQWVFLQEELPSRYQFTASIQAFRKFADSGSAFDDYKVRSVTANVTRFRELILEFREDMGEPIQPFSPPDWKSTIPELASSVRSWLGCPETTHHHFQGWKKLIEDQGVLSLRPVSIPAGQRLIQVCFVDYPSMKIPFLSLSSMILMHVKRSLLRYFMNWDTC